MSNIKLIVGLGNPGKDYEYTRHNLGFLVVKRLADDHKAKFKNSSLSNALEAHIIADGEKVILLMPLTYMNSSGVAIRQYLSKAPIEYKDLLVVADDFAIDFGQIRLRAKGSDGGHNGLKSIIAETQTQDFPRLRLGIGAPSDGNVDHVLSEFTRQEKKELEGFIKHAADCCMIWIEEGINKAMEKYNTREK